MRYFHRIFSILLLIGMMLGWTTSGSILAQSVELSKPQASITEKFEAQVLDELNAGNSDFFVTMTEQADVSYANQLKTKEEKGQYVFETLVATADRTQADLRAFLDGQGVEYKSFYIANIIFIKAGNLDLAMMIAGRNDVARISANHTYQLDDPIIEKSSLQAPSTVEPNITFIKADQVWALGVNGNGTVMAGNDTGLDETHPTIARHYRGCLNPPSCTTWDHNYNWWDATGTYPTDPWDGFGHGTHTTGTMVGDDGGANQIGVAPGAQTIHCKNMTDGGSGSDATFTECFQWDLAPWDLTGSNPNPAMAPDAVNNSWGYWGGNNNVFRTIINNLQSSGILVEVSAGNEGASGCASLRSPGDYWEVLTTGSVNHAATFPGTITGFSSRGPSDLDPSPPNYFPDIMAPGENVRSALPGNQYDYWGGTSMAGPHATALVGLMWSANPALQGNVADTIEIIQNTAVPLSGQNGLNCGGDYSVGPNNDWGFGTIDALAAVQEAIALGGAGQLDGHVTDASSSNPIEATKVEADRDDGGYSKSDFTDVTGYYTMTVAAGTYTVTASAYGYADTEIYPVEVATDTLTTLPIAMTPLPAYTISGYVKDSTTLDPLVGATVEFTDGIPVDPVQTDTNGYYSIQVAEGTWHMLVKAALHQPETREVVVTGALTENFYLDPLPCILLVDDDNNSPDTTAYYTAALDTLGYDYDIYDVGTGGSDGPDADTMQGYGMVFWYSGDKYGSDSAGPNSTDETNLSSYLNGGGKLFLDSQDYLYDMGLTSFGSSYLGISTFSSDNGDASSIIGITGDPVGDGLGPFSLTYPTGFTDYGDIVSAGGGASVAFKANNNNNNLDLDKNGGAWQTVFFGTSWVPLYYNNADNGNAVLQRVVDFFGGCEPPVPPAAVSIEPPTQEATGEPGMQVSYVYTVTNEAVVPQDVTLSLDSVWPAEAPLSTGELAAGESTLVTVTVTIPNMPEVIIGSDTFTLTANGEVGGDDTATGTTYANVTPSVEVTAPGDASGRPLEVVTYEFTLTNSGDYTDTFTLAVDGLWSAALPGGEEVGPLAAGESVVVVVEVTIPGDAVMDDTDTTTLTATSHLDGTVSASDEVTSTAILYYYSHLPIVHR